mgnify:CR=1 FL=1
MEPFAFGMDAPAAGLSAGESSGRLHIADTAISHGDLLEAATSSSWAMGMSYANTEVQSVQDWNAFAPYWSPSASKPQDEAQEFVLADGGAVSNTNIISLLQRKVHRIVSVISSSVPLQSSDNWDPAVGDLSKDDMDFIVPAW